MFSVKANQREQSVRAYRNHPLSRGVAVTYTAIDGIAGRGWVGTMELKEFQDGFPLPATMELTESMTQQLMDDLWAVGLRPSEGYGSAGSLAATERHLEDLRRLVFKKEYKPTVH